MTHKTILIIEDEPSILALLCDLLEGEGYTVRTATNGQEGLASMRAQLPDLVLCDVMMPGMDGRAVYQAMQAHPALCKLPLLFMSAVTEHSLGLDREAYSAFLPKPLDLEQLLQLLQLYLFSG